MRSDGIRWRKSSYSGHDGGACVEVASAAAGIVAIRDSKDPNGPLLVVPASAWRSFLQQVRNGEGRTMG